jgi:RHS repeat-associated protein
MFAYDGLSRRVQIVEHDATMSHTVTSTKNYVWVGQEIAEERDASNNVTKRFFPQGEQQSGTNYYYTRDHLGSVRELMDGSGNIVARYSYDPYGKVTLVSGTNLATKQYAGMYLHGTSGLNLTRYRAYDSNTGRWLSRDPIGEDGGYNLYEYCADDPMDFIDPQGLCCDSCKLLLAQIISKSAALLDDLRRYDPVADGAGGPNWKPGGHYKEISERQAGLKNDIARYLRDCIKKDQGPGGPCPKVPSYIEEMASRPVPVPVYPATAATSSSAPLFTQPEPWYWYVAAGLLGAAAGTAANPATQ